MSAIYKPVFDHGGGGVVNPTGSNIVVKDHDGQTIFAGKATKGSEGSKWNLPIDKIPKDSTFSIDGGPEHTISDPSKRNEYGTNGGKPTLVGGKGSTNTAGTLTTSGVNGVGTPGSVGTFGVAPGFIGDKFPNPVMSGFDPKKDFNFINPLAFGKNFANHQNANLTKNFSQGGDFAQGAINTELKALTNYVPKSAELQRGTVAGDNPFNQGQRTAQVNSAVPDVVKDLNNQAADARTYASGAVPDSIIDKGLEVGNRSAAADAASYSGFGASSGAGRKLSDLMSAKDRIGLSQYGEGLLSSNANARQQLFLAPTEYANAGSQVQVDPSISGSQLQQNNFGSINQATNLDPNSTYQNVTQQSQFVTSTGIQNKQFNVSNANNFALSYFNYLNSYANSVASAGQTSVNTGIGIDQQNAANAAYGKAQKEAQNAGAVKGGLSLLTEIGIAAASDSRLKDNIATYTRGLKDISALNVVSYTYKENTLAEDGKIPHAGLLAQELQGVIPEAVLEKNGYLHVNLEHVIFALVNSVKELTNRLTVLEKA